MCQRSSQDSGLVCQDSSVTLSALFRDTVGTGVRNGGQDVRGGIRADALDGGEGGRLALVWRERRLVWFICEWLVDVFDRN